MDPLLKPVPGDIKQKATNLNRLPNTKANIDNLYKEFIGMPQVCYTLAGVIVHLRRDPESIEHIQQFNKIIDQYSNTLLEHLDVRWLLSICDTYVDIGDPHRSAVAMNIVQCVNGTNLHLTIIANVENGNLDPAKLRQERKAKTWGGMITVDIPNGDMIYNMMTRLNCVVKEDELLNKIWCEIKRRGRGEGNVVMNHLCAYSTIEHQKEYFHDRHSLL